MLKLPALRGQLQLLEGRSDALSGLYEAYEDAATTLDRLLRSTEKSDTGIIAEYRTICAEIESDVIQYCIERARRVPD